MFCDYCRRLFTFTQPALPYTPISKPLKGIRGADVLKIKAGSSTPASDSTPKVEVYEDTRHIFEPRVLWWKTNIGPSGLKDGETHAPTAECQICDMIFSNVSSSFVEALLGKSQKDVSFVYQLKGVAGAVPEAVVSVWLEVGEKLLPMIKLRVIAQHFVGKSPRGFPSIVESTYTGSAETLSLTAS